MILLLLACISTPLDFVSEEPDKSGWWMITPPVGYEDTHECFCFSSGHSTPVQCFPKR